MLLYFADFPYNNHYALYSGIGPPKSISAFLALGTMTTRVRDDAGRVGAVAEGARLPRGVRHVHRAGRVPSWHWKNKLFPDGIPGG